MTLKPCPGTWKISRTKLRTMQHEKVYLLPGCCMKSIFNRDLEALTARRVDNCSLLGPPLRSSLRFSSLARTSEPKTAFLRFIKLRNRLFKNLASPKESYKISKKFPFSLRVTSLPPPVSISLENSSSMSRVPQPRWDWILETFRGQKCRALRCSSNSMKLVPGNLVSSEEANTTLRII